MSISDTARQVMLVAHGQWDPSHGNVKFPKDVRVIHFYAVHEEYGKIAAAPNAARSIVAARVLAPRG